MSNIYFAFTHTHKKYYSEFTSKFLKEKITNKNCATTLQTNKVIKLWKEKQKFSQKAANSHTVHYVIRTLYKK